MEAETDKIQFLVGTQGLKSKLTNQVHLLEVEEENRTMSKTVFSHPAGEVWDLAASPSGEGASFMYMGTLVCLNPHFHYS